jgi:diguanylate cyclase (GGDEF)-like protein
MRTTDRTSVTTTPRTSFPPDPASGRPDRAARRGAAVLTRNLLLLAGIVLVVTCAWFAAGALGTKHEAKLLERERMVATATAETISANLGRNLAQLHSIPLVLASEPSLIATLRRFGPDVRPSALPVQERRAIWQADPEFAALARRFEDIIRQADISQIWVVNAAADCFVSAGFPPDLTATGVNYVKRHYFQEARQGRNGSQFAVGATTAVPGLFFSAPVLAEGHFLGVVVVKLELPKLMPLIANANAFITDENGVVILAQSPDLMMQTMPGATASLLADDALDNRYRRKTFDRVEIRPAHDADSPDLVFWQGSAHPFVLKHKALPGEVVTIHVLRPLDELAQIRRERIWLFALLSVTGGLLAALTAGAAAYLRRSREAREQLTIQANTDALTCCANRRSFLATLEQEWRRAVRYGTPLSVICIDLDYFKSVNDRFGHAGGDQLLCHFADIVGAVLRPCDTFGRIGGEEFAILLPQTPATGAMAVAERIVAEVKERPTMLGTQPHAYTFSAGIAELRPEDAEYADLLNRADRALYRAKSSGRDRVVLDESCRNERREHA